MTTKERQPARVAHTSEWQHIVPIAIAPRTTSEAGPRAQRAPGLAVPGSDPRAAVSVSSDSIAKRMEVYGYDGAFVGRVKEVGDSELVVRRRWRSDTRVPLDRIFAVINGRVILTRGGNADREPEQ